MTVPIPSAPRCNSRAVVFAALVVFVFAGLVLAGQLHWAAALIAVLLLAVGAVLLVRRDGASIESAVAASTETDEVAEGDSGAGPWPTNPIVQALHEPILLVDRKMTVIQGNQAAEALLNQDILGRALETLLREPSLLEAAEDVLAGAGQHELFLTLTGKIKRHFRVQVTALYADGTASGPGGPDFALIALDDLTEVKQSERMRGDFVANVSHELRTPLASINGFIETLRGPARDDSRARDQFLEIMHEQSARMARLIEDLLSLSKIEVKEHSAPTDRVQLADILQSVAQQLAPQADSKGMTLSL